MLSPEVTMLAVQSICQQSKKMPILQRWIKITDLSEAIAQMCESIKDHLPRVIGCRIDEAMLVKSIEKAQKVVEACRASDVHILLPTDFPKGLLAMPNPPVVLYVKGDASLLLKTSVAVVGTRGPTLRGRQFASDIAKQLVLKNHVVVSGLALGCDTQAHQATLEVSGKTIAVLAHGLDQISPKQNKQLAQAILTKGGCWVSEYPPGFGIKNKGQFVARNRIQCGLSTHGVVVVESAQKGGTMHTAQACHQQQKPLACMWLPKGEAPHQGLTGNQKMIETFGATPLVQLSDLDGFLRLEVGVPTLTDAQRKNIARRHLDALQRRIARLTALGPAHMSGTTSQRLSELVASSRQVRSGIEGIQAPTFDGDKAIVKKARKGS